MIPGFMFAFGSLSTAPWMTFAPMIGQHMLITSVVRGDVPAPASVAVLSAITLAVGMAAWAAASNLLQQETVLRRTRG
jgi:hypothetical protein